MHSRLEVAADPKTWSASPSFPPLPDLYGLQTVYSFLGVPYPAISYHDDAIPDPSINFLPLSAVALSRYSSGPFGVYDEVRSMAIAVESQYSSSQCCLLTVVRLLHFVHLQGCHSNLLHMKSRFPLGMPLIWLFSALEAGQRGFGWSGRQLYVGICGKFGGTWCMRKILVKENIMGTLGIKGREIEVWIIHNGFPHTIENRMTKMLRF